MLSLLHTLALIQLFLFKQDVCLSKTEKHNIHVSSFFFAYSSRPKSSINIKLVSHLLRQPSDLAPP